MHPSKRSCGPYRSIQFTDVEIMQPSAAVQFHSLPFRSIALLPLLLPLALVDVDNKCGN
jgi:hypothetical protein